MTNRLMKVKLIDEYPFKVRKKKGVTVIAGLYRFHKISGKAFLVAYENSIQFWQKEGFAPGGKVIEISNGQPGFSIKFEGETKHYSAGELARITISAGPERNIAIS